MEKREDREKKLHRSQHTFKIKTSLSLWMHEGVPWKGRKLYSREKSLVVPSADEDSVAKRKIPVPAEDRTPFVQPSASNCTE
jgi:hypothetical protein